MNTQGAFNTMASTKTSSVRLLLGWTEISLTSPKRWTMNLITNWADVGFERFGGKLASMMVVVKTPYNNALPSVYL
jgi:hypothetical protein